MLACSCLFLIGTGLLWAQLNEGHYYLRRIPNVPLILTDGEQRPLHSIVRERSVILTLFSARCGGLCSPYLLYLKRALGTAPQGYTVLVLSFDPRDGLEDVRATAQRLGLADHPTWRWGLLPQEYAEQLRTALGYSVLYDSSRGEYDHSIVVCVLDQRGNLLRRMEGFQDPLLLKDLIREARGEFVLSYPIPSTAVALRCFELDRETGAWRLSWGMSILLLPPVSSLVLVLVLQLCLRPRGLRPSPRELLQKPSSA